MLRPTAAGDKKCQCHVGAQPCCPPRPPAPLPGLQQQRREAPGQSRPRCGAAAASSAPAEGPASAAEGGAAVTEAQRVSETGPQGLAEWHKGKPKARGSRAASRPRGTPLGSGSEPLGHEEGRGQAPELSGATRPCCSHSLGWGRAAGATQPPGTARGSPSPGDSQPHAAAPCKRLRPHLPVASRQLQPPQPPACSQFCFSLPSFASQLNNSGSSPAFEHEGRVIRTLKTETRRRLTSS